MRDQVNLLINCWFRVRFSKNETKSSLLLPDAEDFGSVAKIIKTIIIETTDQLDATKSII